MDYLAENVRFVVQKSPHLFRDFSESRDARTLLLLAFTRTIDRASLTGKNVTIPKIPSKTYDGTRKYVATLKATTVSMDAFEPSIEFLREVEKITSVSNVPSNNWNSMQSLESVYNLFAEELARAMSRLLEST